MKKKKLGKARFLYFFLVAALTVGIMPAAAFAQDNSVNHTTLIYSNFSFPEARSTELTGYDNVTDMFVFTANGGDLDTYNREQLFYSVHMDYGPFTVPKLIKDDDTWDMEPFLFSDDRLILAWTDATQKFSSTSTGEEVATSMRIAVAVNESPYATLAYTVSNTDFYGSDNICTYNPKITKVDGKLLITWIVCNNVKNDAGSYSIEGLYYDIQTNTFYSENVDSDNNPKPMVFAKNCNYISSYAVADRNNSAAAIFQEPTAETHISDIMFSKVIAQNRFFSSDKHEKSTLKLATDNGGNVTELTDGNSYASVVESKFPELLYYNNGKIYMAAPVGQTELTTEFGDVSKTGDTNYSTVFQGKDLRYITALQRVPLKTNETETSVNDTTYKKTDDGKWSDGQGNIIEIMQEDICFYYINPNTQKFETLSQKLSGENGKKYASFPQFFVNQANKLECLQFIGETTSPKNHVLTHSVYGEHYLFQGDYSAVTEAVGKAALLNETDYKDFAPVTAAVNAVVYGKDYTEQATIDGYAAAIEQAIKNLELVEADYSKVDEAIAKANALNKDDYKDFSAVTQAVNAVVRGKPFTEQNEVDAMAKAIEDAVEALELKPAITPTVEKPKIIEGASQSVEQGKPATFKSSAELKDFQRVLLDGKELDPANYILKQGSTVVTLKGEFVKTLATGTHSLSIVSTTGSADTEFTVTAASVTEPTVTNPTPTDTGDSNAVLVLAILFALSSCALPITFKRKKLAK